MFKTEKSLPRTLIGFFFATLLAFGIAEGGDLRAGFVAWGSTQEATLYDDMGDGIKKHTPLGSTLKSVETFDPRYS